MPEGTQPVDDPIAIAREMIEIGWNLHRLTIRGIKLTTVHVAQETELHKLEEAFARLQLVLTDVGAARRQDGLERLRLIVAKLGPQLRPQR